MYQNYFSLPSLLSVRGQGKEFKPFIVHSLAAGGFGNTKEGRRNPVLEMETRSRG